MWHRNFWKRLSLRISCQTSLTPISRCYSITQIPRRNRLRSPRIITHETFTHCKAARSRVRGAVVVVLVDDGVDHDCLLVYRNGAVGRHCDPIVCPASCVSTPTKEPRIECTECRGRVHESSPLSKVKGSLATSTISAPLSRLSILYWPGPSPRFQLVPEEKYSEAASSVVLLTYFVHTTL